MIMMTIKRIFYSETRATDGTKSFTAFALLLVFREQLFLSHLIAL